MSGLCVSFHFWFFKVSLSYSECGHAGFVYTRVLSDLTMWAGRSAFCTRLLFSCSVMSDSLWPHGLQPTRLPFSGSFPSLGWSFTISQSLLKLLSIESVSLYQFSSVQSLSRVQLFATPWIIASQASLSITNSRSLLKLMSIESVMPSSHLIFCRPLLLLPPIPSSIRVFSNESTLCIRWPKYWSFSFSVKLPVIRWEVLCLSFDTEMSDFG